MRIIGKLTSRLPKFQFSTEGLVFSKIFVNTGL